MSSLKACNDEIAVVVGVWAFGVELVALAVGVAGEVEPVASPTFAVGRVVEQVIDEPGVGVGGVVGEEGLYLRGSGRQTEQIEVEAADERALVSGRRRRQSVRF